MRQGVVWWPQAIKCVCAPRTVSTKSATNEVTGGLFGERFCCLQNNLGKHLPQHQTPWLARIPPLQIFLISCILWFLDIIGVFLFPSGSEWGQTKNLAIVCNTERAGLPTGGQDQISIHTYIHTHTYDLHEQQVAARASRHESGHGGALYDCTAVAQPGRHRAGFI